ncbi:MAG: FAD-linked oxidase C-terminal domain-containing protein [Saprospiraceae bacterium]|nr:FAD-linked oxidase C-terminal domain-containing protein [Saprospiraceae bacterium]
MSSAILNSIKAAIKGELFTDNLHKIIYATDASVYREIPLGVVYPKDSDDIQEIIIQCNANQIPILPRAGGTSLAGQCVGEGLVVDISKHLTTIIDIDPELKTVTVQPGVIRDELNSFLKPYGLMFGPNTSTANRAMIGGMVGNNSCGSTSIVFGNTRDHVHELKAILSDGSEVTFCELTQEQFDRKCAASNLEGEIYRHLNSALRDSVVQEKIKTEFPKSSIQRRNTGYAIDALVETELFSESSKKINVCNLICGSEGTLAFITEIKIGLVDVPPPHEVLVALQFDDVIKSLEVIPTVMNHCPFACELMDKTILDCTKGQLLYEKDRAFLKGDPKAVLLVSFVAEDHDAAKQAVLQLISSLHEEFSYFEYSIVEKGIDRIWNLRKAGLGLLANLPGDKKAVACIEDTAVAIEDLSRYIHEFSKMMEAYGQKSVYYAHAGAGEIHLRPILDLKKERDRALFYKISLDSARLVKKYKGSLSGEHGDGRVRAPFIQEMVGDVIYNLFVELKSVWDPKGIFNPGKIVDAKTMTEDLRFDRDHIEKDYETQFDFSPVGGILRAAEKCNGSGDCRKLPLSGGTMCPSYMATRNEKDTTRARANVLREVLTRSEKDTAWNSHELKDVMDLCLSCKGCSSECPSNMDMSSMKAEVLYQSYKSKGVPFRSRLFANFNKLNWFGNKISSLANFVTQSNLTAPLLKRGMGVHPQRTLPKINTYTLSGRFERIYKEYSQIKKHKKVYLFIDEFTNYNDEGLGETGLRLLLSLGYDVHKMNHVESGRAAISKGVLDHAVKCAEKNISIFYPVISESVPLIGIEPSAILTFIDEYPRMVKGELQKQAKQLSKHVFPIESFLYQEVQSGTLTSEHFGSEKTEILLHGHCHQKALTDMKEVAWILSLPEQYSVEIIPSGCCGMAGSFGYEKEHYSVSMKIGELVLFPAIRSKRESQIVVASGTSCRHQISDGTKVKAMHPVEILFQALK